MAMVSCTEDYTDWANPQINPEEEAVAFGNGSVTPVDVINLANVTEEKIQVASIVAPTSSDAGYTPTIKINLGDKTYDIDNDGKMATSETFQVKAIPVAPVIDEGYYLVGDMFNAEGVDGWNTVSAKQAFKHSDKDVYDDPIFTLTFETKEANQCWKVIPKKNIDAETFWAAGVVGPKIDGDVSMTGLLTSDGWKFIVNKDWPINLGGSIDNLEQDGANLTVAGNTIKLYPTRKTNDNIFCTVE